MPKTKQYFYEQEERDICEAIQNIDFSDPAFENSIEEGVIKLCLITYVKMEIGYLPFRTDDEIKDMILCYYNEKGNIYQEGGE
tara:strand:+ start:245 stop:493 length:249 start_codon:yes stop_codon:yes gene_type:complete